MADIKTKYPATSTVAVTVTLAGLANSSSLLAGREATAVDNTVNQDVDHILSGKLRTHASVAPTAGTRIEVWVFAPRQIAAGAYTWPHGATGSDAALALTSDNTKFAGWLKQAASITVDAAAARDYEFGGVSIASLFGGVLPSKYSVWVTNGTGQALDATAGNHSISYERVQAQTV